jgi:hypothetical protein
MCPWRYGQGVPHLMEKISARTMFCRASQKIKSCESLTNFGRDFLKKRLWLFFSLDGKEPKDQGL